MYCHAWDALFLHLQAEDPYGRPTSIHHYNNGHMYDHSREYITHISLQIKPPGGGEQLTMALRAGTYCPGGRWGWKHCPYLKPVIWDEVQYEGSLRTHWAKLSGVEMADRFWWGFSLGVYVGHSDTLGGDTAETANDRWWTGGGVLRGESPPLIARFHAYAIDEWHPPFGELTPLAAGPANRALVQLGRFALIYLQRSGLYVIELPGATNTERFCARQVERASYERRILGENLTNPATLYVGSDGIGGVPLIELRVGACTSPPPPPQIPPPPVSPLPASLWSPPPVPSIPEPLAPPLPAPSPLPPPVAPQLHPAMPLLPPSATMPISHLSQQTPQPHAPNPPSLRPLTVSWVARWRECAAISAMSFAGGMIALGIIWLLCASRSGHSRRTRWWYVIRNKPSLASKDVAATASVDGVSLDGLSRTIGRVGSTA